MWAMTASEYKEEIIKCKILVMALKEDNADLKAEIESLKKKIQELQEK